MRFLAISKPTPQRNLATLQQLRQAEAQRSQELYKQGFLLEGYLDQGRTTAYFLVEATNLQEAEQILSTYPHVQAGQSQMEVIALIGLPSIAQFSEEHHQRLPVWWPQ